MCGALAGAFFYFGASSALSRWYYDFTGVERGKAITTALLITWVGVLLQSAIGWFSGDWIARMLFGDSNYGLHVSLALISSALTFLNGLLILVLRFERRAVLTVCVNLATVIFTVAIIWSLLAQWHMGVMAPILGILIVQAVLAVLLMVACRKMMAWGVLTEQVLPMLRFGMTASVLGVVYYVMEWLDRLVLQNMGGLDDVGVYSVGARVASILQVVFIMAFGQIWQPMRMQYRHDGNASDLFRLVLTYYFMAGLLCVVTITVFSPDIYRLLGGDAGYQSGHALVPWLTMAALLYGAVNVLDIGVFVAKKVYWHVIIFTTCAALNLGLNVVIIPHFGCLGAAWAKVVTYTVLALLMYAISNRYLPIRYEATRIAALLAIAIGCMVAAAGLETWVSGPGKLLYVVAFIGLTSVLVLTAKERAAGLAMSKRIFHAT